MPPLNGAGKFEIIKELVEGNCKSPMIFILNDPAPANVIATIKAGAFDLVVRPFDVDELREKVKEACAHYEELQGKTATAPCDDLSIPIGTSLQDAEEKLIAATIKNVGNSIPKAARILGVSASTIYRKLEPQKGI